MFFVGQKVRRKLKYRDDPWWRVKVRDYKIDPAGVFTITSAFGDGIFLAGITGNHEEQKFELVFTTTKPLEEWM